MGGHALHRPQGNVRHPCEVLQIDYGWRADQGEAPLVFGGTHCLDRMPQHGQGSLTERPRLAAEADLEDQGLASRISVNAQCQTRLDVGLISLALRSHGRIAAFFEAFEFASFETAFFDCWIGSCLLGGCLLRGCLLGSFFSWKLPPSRLPFSTLPDRKLLDCLLCGCLLGDCLLREHILRECFLRGRGARPETKAEGPRPDPGLLLAPGVFCCQDLSLECYTGVGVKPQCEDEIAACNKGGVQNDWCMPALQIFVEVGDIIEVSQQSSFVLRPVEFGHVHASDRPRVDCCPSVSLIVVGCRTSWILKVSLELTVKVAVRPLWVRMCSFGVCQQTTPTFGSPPRGRRTPARLPLPLFLCFTVQ